MAGATGLPRVTVRPFRPGRTLVPDPDASAGQTFSTCAYSSSLPTRIFPGRAFEAVSNSTGTGLDLLHLRIFEFDGCRAPEDGDRDLESGALLVDLLHV